VGGPGGWVALRQDDKSQPTLRKFHPFAVTGLGFSTDGEWVATASASGDMRLLRRSDVAAGSKIGQLASRSIMTGKLVTYMLLQKYKGDYAVREFALSVAPHDGRRAERDDVTVIALTQADRLLVWRTPGPIGKQITGVDQLEIRGRFAAIATDPSSQLVWAARAGSLQSSTPQPARPTDLGLLQPDASDTLAFAPCDALADSRSVTMISWNGDGTRLAVGFHDGTIRVLARSGPEPCALDTLVELPAHDAAISTVTWHRGDVLASGAADGSARLWNLQLTSEDRTLLAALRRLDDVASYAPTFELLAARLGRL
jgi:WD40 repeat protein